MLAAMKKIPEIVDDLASAFYELDGPEIDQKMKLCSSAACTASEFLLENWEGQKDEFTDWVCQLASWIMSLSIY